MVLCLTTVDDFYIFRMLVQHITRARIFYKVGIVFTVLRVADQQLFVVRTFKLYSGTAGIAGFVAQLDLVDIATVIRDLSFYDVLFNSFTLGTEVGSKNRIICFTNNEVILIIHVGIVLATLLFQLFLQRGNLEPFAVSEFSFAISALVLDSCSTSAIRLLNAVPYVTIVFQQRLGRVDLRSVVISGDK